MVREFKLPDVGEGVAEGEIVRWLVEPGDAVEEDQPVAEVETDKAVVDVPAPVDGTVKEILADEGEVVPVGEVIITFDVAGEEADAAADAGESDEAEARAAEGAMEEAGTAGAEAAQEVADEDEGVGSANAEPAEAGDPETEAAIDADAETASSGRAFAPPSVRRLAREEGVDLGSVDGSGPGGRVTAGDVRAAASGGDEQTVAGDDAAAGDAAAAASSDADAADAATDAEATTDAASQQPASTDETGGQPAGVDAADSADRDRTLAAPATRRVAREEGVDLNAVPATEQRDGEAFVSEQAVREYAQAQREAQAADAQALQVQDADVPATETADAASASAGTAVEGERERRRPYRGIRRTIGERMSQSKFTAPHVTHHDTADATRLVETRERLKSEAEERGIRLTYMPFVMKACVAALKEHPIVNAQLDEEAGEIVEKRYYNVGVAADTEAGLMVPVVDDVDEKGLLQVASETNELVQKARERSIERAEMQDGTFTITNFGGIGGDFATPIINHPEVAILGLGAIDERPVAEDGEVVARKTLPLSLSIDHRVVDGADAARFTNTLKEYLEEPSLLLLE